MATWPDPQVEYEAAEREVAHWSEIYRDLNERLLSIEQNLSEAIQRRDAAERALT